MLSVGLVPRTPMDKEKQVFFQEYTGAELKLQLDPEGLLNLAEALYDEVVLRIDISDFPEEITRSEVFVP